MGSRLQDVILRGLRAAQPAPDDLSAGTLYYVTDEQKTERVSDDRTTWESYSDASSGANIIHQTVITLTDAQLKAMHTVAGAVQLIAAPGSQQILLPRDITLIAHFTVRYDELPDWSSLLILNNPNDIGNSVITNFFNVELNERFLNAMLTNGLSSGFENSTSDHITRLLIPASAYNENWGENRPSNFAKPLTSALGLPVFIRFDTSGTALTGGTSGNTLKVAIIYQTLDLALGLFV
jgi:hypothetical protein